MNIQSHLPDGNELFAGSGICGKRVKPSSDRDYILDFIRKSERGIIKAR